MFTLKHTTSMSIDPCIDCGFELDDGDIFVKLRRMPENDGKTNNDIRAIARYYGWTEQNKKRFTKRIIVQPFDRAQFVMCPNCKVILQTEQ